MLDIVMQHLMVLSIKQVSLLCDAFGFSCKTICLPDKFVVTDSEFWHGLPAYEAIYRGVITRQQLDTSTENEL